MSILLLSIQTGLPRTVDGPYGEWTSGIWKEPVSGPVWAGKTNLAGDGQQDLKAHGGVDQPVYVYPAGHYDFWRGDLNIPDLPYGGFGENFTIAGLDERQACIGDVFKVGDTVVTQVSGPRGPCWKLARRWDVKDLVQRVDNSGYTGWYVRVLQEGYVEAGMGFELLEHPYPEWTISTVNRLMHHTAADLEAARRLAACPALSENWRMGLAWRIDKAMKKSTGDEE